MILVFNIFFTFSFNHEAYANDSDDKIVTVFFVSPTCSSCANTKEYVKSVDTELIVYDISEKNNLALLYKYCEEYSVPDDDTGMVPIVFVGDTYLFTQEKIEAELENSIREAKKPTKILSVDDGDEISNLKAVNIVSIFAAGIVNGFNPCSLSLLLFLLTLIMANPKNVLKYGLSFLVGKFVAFFLLGTLLFNILNKIKLSSVDFIFSILFVAFAISFFIINFYDFLKAKNKKYDKMLLMLPKGIIKNNHKLMKVIDFQGSLPIIAVICFGMGILIACGEFLCTGQVYLATIIAMIQIESDFDIKSVIYLLIYDLGFIIPLLTVIIIIDRLKNVQKISKIFTDKLYIIKLVNSIAFLIFAVLYIILR